MQNIIIKNNECIFDERDQSNTVVTRKNCVDVWNAFMVKNASFSANDIPICPTYLPNGIPTSLIPYSVAKSIYNREYKNNNDFHVNSFIHFFEDDQNFDGKRNSIWTFPLKALEVIQHFSGIICPDFSTYADFPEPIKRYNIYRMRAFGYWCQSLGIPVINCLRWGTKETWSYCYDGIPNNDVVCIGTVASGLRELVNRPDFEKGFYKAIDVLCPNTIIVYGSSNYTFFDYARRLGISIIGFDSKTNTCHKGGVKNEQIF